METFKVEGTNAAGFKGTWDVGAEDSEALRERLKDRGITASKIDGESVKKAKPKTLKGDD